MARRSVTEHTMPAGDLHRLRDIALEAARTGARIVREARRPSVGDEKAAGDYVTEVDRASERAIHQVLATATPSIPMLGEEFGAGAGSDEADVFWAVDPLDGTRNYLLGFPVVGVSVAAVARQRPAEPDASRSRLRPVAGAVTAPFLDLEFSAALGQGATGNGQAIHVSDRPFPRAIVATGFPFRNHDLLPRHSVALRAVLEEADDVRRAGAAALDLAWTAAGVFDGFFELGLSVWDVAAGSLLVTEAGGVVTDWDGGQASLDGNILAGSPATHEGLLRIARAAGDRGDSGSRGDATASPSA